LNKRLVDTAFGSALLIPKDENPILLCTPASAIDARNRSWVKVEEIKSQKSLDEAIVKFSSASLKNERAKLGMNISVLNYESYYYFKKKMKIELINIEKTILPKVF